MRDNCCDTSTKRGDTRLIDDGRIGALLPCGREPPHFTLRTAGVVSDQFNELSSMGQALWSNTPLA